MTLRWKTVTVTKALGSLSASMAVGTVAGLLVGLGLDISAGTVTQGPIIGMWGMILGAIIGVVLIAYQSVTGTLTETAPVETDANVEVESPDQEGTRRPFDQKTGLAILASVEDAMSAAVASATLAGDLAADLAAIVDAHAGGNSQDREEVLAAGAEEVLDTAAAAAELVRQAVGQRD